MTNAAALKVTTPSDCEIVLTRIFDAPRSLVFDAWSKPELVKRWLHGPAEWSMVLCDIDLRVGGAYRYEWRNSNDATEIGMSGVFREIVPPERLVATESFDAYPGESVSTVVMTEQDGKTLVTNTILYESKYVRDAVLKSGMESGVSASYSKLDELLASMN